MLGDDPRRAGHGARVVAMATAHVSGPVSGATTMSSPPEADPRLVACPTCGAPNAGSRTACGRCHGGLADGPAGASGVAEEDPGAEGDAERPSNLLIAMTAIAVLAGVAVLVALLSARGVGPFATDAGDVLGDAELASIAAVRASSERRPSDDMSYVAEHVADGDTSTAWVAEDGGEPWIELELVDVAEVTGLVLWNGNQADDAFARHDRVAALRIETDERAFEVDLLDSRGPLAIDLPEPVAASRVRLVVEEVFSGDEVPGPALSRVVVRVLPEG